MKTSDIKKAQSLINALNGIEKELLELKEIANFISSDNHVAIDLKLKFTDLNEKEKEDNKVTLYSDGGLDFHTGNYSNPFILNSLANSIYIRSTEKNTIKYTKKVDKAITDSSALRIIAILQEEKLNNKENILQALRLMGVEIEND